METAQREAKTSNKRVEIPSYKSETSRTFANPDGKTLYTEIHSTPVRVRKDGAWQSIDPTFVEVDGEIRPKAATGGLTLSRGGKTPLVKIRNNKAEAQIFGPGQLPKPKLKGNTATYKSAYGKGIDLVITATATGFIQEAVLRQRPADALKLRVPVRLPKGMKYGKDSAGKPALLTEQDNTSVAAIDSAPMLDATATGQPDTGHTGKATMAIEQGDDGSALVVIPDSEFLANPKVTYPVRVAIASDTWVGTGIAGDTFVNNAAYPNGAANNNLNRILVGKSNSGTVTWRGYIRFNIPDTPLMGGTVKNADLRLWNYDTNDCSDDDTAGIVARQVSSNWQMSTLTWNRQPSVTTTGQVGNYGAYGVDCPEGEGELYYSIEQMVQGWMDGTPDYGLQLSSASESVPTNWRWYRSFEYGGYDGFPEQPRGPVVFIEYEPKLAEPEAQGFFIPGPSDGTTPTDEEIAANLVDRADHPTLPQLGEEQLQALREDAQDSFTHDARFGFYPVEEITREEWVEALEPDQETFEPEPGTTPPVVVSTEPAANANDVPVSAALRVTFNGPIADPVFVVKDAAGTPVEGETTFQDTLASFVPAQPLAVTTTYTATISGTVDVDGNPMAAPHSWSFTTASVTAPAEGLVAAYGLDEGAGTSVSDASGNGNTGEARDTTWVAGKHGQALSFNGVNSMISVDDAPSLRPDSAMTLSAWVNPTDSTGWRSVILKETTAGGDSYSLYSSSEDLGPSAWLDLDGGESSVGAWEPLPLNTWSHLAVTYDGSTARLYVNGDPVAEEDMSGTLVNDEGPLGIGGSGIWDEFFEGVIDEVRIYNLAQTAEQILGDMDTPISGSTPGLVTPAQTPARSSTLTDTPPSTQSPTTTAKASAATPFPYDRIDGQKPCRDDRPATATLWRWVKNSFNVCYTGVIGEVYTVDGVSTGEKWSAVISVVVHTYVGHHDNNTAARGEAGIHSRQMKVWIKVDDFKPGAFPGAAARPFSVHVNNTAGCTSDKPNGISNTVYNWTQGADRVIVLTSPANTGLPEYRSNCGIQPSVYYPETDDPEKRVGLLDDERVEFRCDSSNRIKLYTGGCVVWSARPVWHLDGNHEPSEQTAEHIWNALYDADNTDTKYPGKKKRIPGKINLSDRGCKSQVGCLTRDTSRRKTTGTVANLNWKAAVRECKKLPTPSHVTKRSCDEFPFASTNQGVAKAGINFSVAIVDCSDNSSGGASLAAWYLRERILQNDPFWVDVTKKGQQVPAHVTPPDSHEPDVSECDS